MSKTGEDNPNYKNGLYCKPQYCDCGREKDYRAKQCSICSGRVNPISKKLVAEKVAKCNSLSKAAKELGVSRHKVTLVVKELGLDTSHMRAARGRDKPIESYFVKGDKRTNGVIRRKVLENELIEYICSECSQQPLWNGKELTLDLEHINGDPTDNRLENLTFLCPNCHSQTSTYKGRNSGRKDG